MMCIINSESFHGSQKRSGVWSSGMILALGDFLNKQEDKACERPWVQFPARPLFCISGHNILSDPLVVSSYINFLCNFFLLTQY